MEVRQEEINDELLPLLKSDRPDVRYQTSHFFLQLTGSSKGLLLLYNTPCLEGIAALLEDPDANIVELALKILINLSAEESIAVAITGLRKPPGEFVKSLIYYCLEEESVHADHACKLLSNLSRAERCARRIVDVMTSSSDVGFSRLVQVFCTMGYNSRKANLDYLGPFLANLTQIEETRKYLLDQGNCVIQRLLAFTDYQESQVRRQGIVATIRNCCFETDSHEWLLGDEVDILPRLLLPLAGPEEFDEDDMEKLPDQVLPPQLQYLEPEKQREPVPEIRKMLVEAVFSLCATKPGRDVVKAKNTYVIVRELHKFAEREGDKELDLAVDKLVTVLIGDEPVTDNLRQYEVPEKVRKVIDESNEAALRDDDVTSQQP